MRGINLVLNQVSLEVFVGDETITICIECSEDLEGARLTLAESSIFNLTENTTESASSSLIIDVTTSCSREFCINKGRRRVRSLTRVKSQSQLVGVGLEHKRGNGSDISGTVDVVLKRGQETFKISLCKSSLDNFILASLVDHKLHLFNGDVSVLVSIDVIPQVSLKLILGLELILQESVNLNELFLNNIELVSRDVLRVENDHVIVEDVALNKSTKVGSSST